MRVSIAALAWHEGLLSSKRTLEWLVSKVGKDCCTHCIKQSCKSRAYDQTYDNSYISSPSEKENCWKDVNELAQADEIEGPVVHKPAQWKLEEMK
jgi:hypothetical protein